MEQFDIIVKKCIDGSISIKEAILQLRGEGKFKDVSFIVLYIWLLNLQNSKVQSLVPIDLPNKAWLSNGANQRPPYTGGYGSSNPGSSLGLANTNDGFQELSQIEIKNLVFL